MKLDIEKFLKQDKECFSREEIENLFASIGLIKDDEKSKCHCYHKVTERHYYTEFEKGFYYARHGKFPPDYEEQEVGVCWGTKECDRCSCMGYTYLCDFYPEKERNETEHSK